MDEVDLFGFSKSQINSIKFAFNKINKGQDYEKFKSNNYQFEMTQDDIFEKLINLTEFYNVSSIIQMAISVKSTNPNKYNTLPKKLKRFLNYKNQSTVKPYTRETNDAIERLVIAVSKNPYMYPIIGKPILLTMCTNLRLGELLQLTIDDLDKIGRGDQVSIKIKKRKKTIQIIVIGKLFEKFINFFKSDVKKNGKVIKYSHSFINKKIKTVLEEYGALVQDIKGVQCLRKFNSSKLLQETTIENVANFNRHRNQNTTMNYYNTGFYKIGNKTATDFI